MCSNSLRDPNMNNYAKHNLKNPEFLECDPNAKHVF